MTPTPKLRFVARTTFVGNSHTVTERVLQQWWALDTYNEPDWWGAVVAGEWRDVPLEEET